MESPGIHHLQLLFVHDLMLVSGAPFMDLTSFHHPPPAGHALGAPPKNARNSMNYWLRIQRGCQGVDKDMLKCHLNLSTFQLIIQGQEQSCKELPVQNINKTTCLPWKVSSPWAIQELCLAMWASQGFVFSPPDRDGVLEMLLSNRP